MMISKPPKKRYLENGAFCHRIESKTSAHDQQTTNACSALLELAMSSNVANLEPKELSVCVNASTLSENEYDDTNLMVNVKRETFSEQQEKKVSHQQLINCIVENSMTVANHVNEPSISDMDIASRSFRNELDNFRFHKTEPFQCNYSSEVSNQFSAAITSANSLLAESGDANHTDGTFKKLVQAYDRMEVPERRKSQRKGKGNRYQTFILEGILQPAKDKRCVNSNTINGHSGKSSVILKEEPQCRVESTTVGEKSCIYDKDQLSVEAERNDMVTSKDGCPDSSHHNQSHDVSNHAYGAQISPNCSELAKNTAPRRKFKKDNLKNESIVIPQVNIERSGWKARRRRKKRSTTSGSQSRTDSDDTSPLSKDQKPSLNNLVGASAMEVGYQQHLVGSQKRKARKHSITHLNPNQNNAAGLQSTESIDQLSGLVTLARAATENIQPDEHG